MLKRIGIAATLGSIAGCTSGSSSEYPSDSLTLVNPYPPGGGTDVYFSKFVDPFSKKYGVDVSQDYEAGGNGAIAHRKIMDTDSHYMMVNNNIPGHTLTQLNLQNPGYDLRKFTGICSFAKDAAVIITRDDSKYTNFKQLRQAYQNGDLETIGGVGTGNNFHLTAWQMKQQWKLSYKQYAGYEGGGPAIAAVLRDEVPAALVATSPVISYAKNDKVNVLLTVGSKPPQKLPDVPIPSDYNLKHQQQIAAAGVLYRTIFAPPVLTDDQQQTLSDGALNAMKSDNLKQWSQKSGNPLNPENAKQAEQYNKDSFEIKDLYQRFKKSTGE